MAIPDVVDTSIANMNEATVNSGQLAIQGLSAEPSWLSDSPDFIAPTNLTGLHTNAGGLPGINGPIDANRFANFNGPTGVDEFTDVNGLAHTNGFAHFNGPNGVDEFTDINGFANFNGPTGVVGLTDANEFTFVNELADFNWPTSYNESTFADALNSVDDFMDTMATGEQLD
ncbi:hypothetical protein NA57DRAFT_78648 [Rhizodiscina lignyota]|uniref:Uncharacterized protein n=1 Tax=Rhizodiscina lignyota TaxID=1504668 RepID=A0A9P4I645_9PEZI|nr:hypothetical protein NA57DRAFT_78648 [Rhizodiscina lignyota]